MTSGPLIPSIQNDKDMQNNKFFLPCLLWILLSTLGIQAQAQRPAALPARITLHVDGLTSATRDALNSTTTPGEPRLVFACVPAGILVLESTANETPAQLESRIVNALTSRSAAERARVVDQSLEQAEAACASIRNR